MKTQTETPQGNRLMQCSKQGYFTGLHSNQRQHTLPTFRSRLQTNLCPCGARLVEVSVSDESVGASRESHTPGPWEARPDPTEPRLHVIWHEDGIGTLVARTCYAIRSEANARLIASAPDLLAALQAIVGGGNVDRGAFWAVDSDDIEQARQAIAKATGAAQ